MGIVGKRLAKARRHATKEQGRDGDQVEELCS
jgi:hypothetical protein